MSLKFNCTCPNCNVDFSKLNVVDDTLTCVDKEGNDEPEKTLQGPEPGHAMICPFCGDMSVFTDTLQLRSPTAKEVEKYSFPDWDKINAPYYTKEIH